MLHLVFALCLATPALLTGCTDASDAIPAAEAALAPEAADYEAALTELLQAVVDANGNVDYAALASDHAGAFAEVKAAIEGYDPGRLTTDAEKSAFLYNAYNVHMLANIVGAPEVDDIAAAGKFEDFFQSPVTVAGATMTLNELENGVLRMQGTVDDRPLADGLKAFRPSTLDPRLHVALNCAAASCPRLQREAFTADRLDAQLDAAFADWVNGSRFAATEGDGMILSNLIDWFGADFDATGVPAGDYFLASMSPERVGYTALQEMLQGHDSAVIRSLVAERSNVQFAYDWTVNRAN